MSVPVVNDDRKAQLEGDVQLAFKCLDLLVRRRMATEEVKAYLAPRNDLGLRS